MCTTIFKTDDLVHMKVKVSQHLLNLVTQALDMINKIVARQLVTVSIKIIILFHGLQRKLIQYPYLDL